MQWNDREVQKVCQEDLQVNYGLLKAYLLRFGGKSPLADLYHHEACEISIQVSCLTFRCVV